MLKKHELTKIENGGVVGPMSPMLFVKEFLKTCKCPQALKIWRVEANMEFKDGRERGNADMLLALLTEGAMVLLIDFGVGGMGAGVKWHGREAEVFNEWKEQEEFFDPPTDDELLEIINSVDVETELAELRKTLAESEKKEDKGNE